MALTRVDEDSKVFINILLPYNGVISLTHRFYFVLLRRVTYSPLGEMLTIKGTEIMLAPEDLCLVHELIDTLMF